MTVLRVGGKVDSVSWQGNWEPGEVVQISGKVAVVALGKWSEVPLG